MRCCVRAGCPPAEYLHQGRPKWRHGDVVARSVIDLYLARRCTSSFILSLSLSFWQSLVNGFWEKGIMREYNGGG